MWWDAKLTGRSQLTNDSIANYVSGLGTEQDSTTAGRPTLCDRLTNYELTALFLADDVSKRIVTELVEDATRGGWKVRDRATGKPLIMPEDAPPIVSKQAEAATWGRLYGAGVLLMVPEDASADLGRPRALDTPIRSLVTFDRLELTTNRWDTDPLSPTFGQPLLIDVHPDRVGGASAAQMGRLRGVHRSWFLLYGGNPMPHTLQGVNDGYDDSVLQVVWNVVRRFLQAEQGIANVITRFETATIAISGLAAALSTEEGQRLIQQRMALLQQTISMVNAAVVDADANEKYERRFATVQGLDVLWDRLAHSVAKAAGMPMPALFGMAPSGLSGDDKAGKANWRKRVAAYQGAQFKTNLQTFYRAFNGGRAVDIDFHPLDEITPSEEVLNTESLARSIGLLMGAGAIDAEEARELLRNGGVRLSDRGAPPPPESNAAQGTPIAASNGGVRQMVERSEEGEARDAIRRAQLG